MNNTLFSVMINLYQGFLMIYFMKKRLIWQKHFSVWDAVFVLITGGALCLWEFAGIELNDNLIFVFPLLYSLLFSEEKWIYSLFWSLVLCAAFLVSENVIIHLFKLQGYSMDELFQESEIRISLILSVNAMITLVVSLLAHFRLHPFMLSARVSLCFVLTLMMECIVSEALFVLQLQDDQSRPVYTWVCLGMLLTMILTIILFEMMTAISAQKRLSELKLQTTHLIQSHQRELTGIYTGMLAAQHDLRHRIDVMERLLESDGTDERIRNSVAELLKDTEAVDRYVTGNAAVDAVLTAKQSVMRRSGIDFRFSFCPLEPLPIAEQDFCVLLSEMLDNAAEGVIRRKEGSAPGEIRLLFARTWNMFSVICENSMDPSTIRQRHGRFLSSKEHAEIHGFGTQSMKQIVESAGGDICFKVKEDSFAVEIMLPEEERS